MAIILGAFFTFSAAQERRNVAARVPRLIEVENEVPAAGRTLNDPGLKACEVFSPSNISHFSVKRRLSRGADLLPFPGEQLRSVFSRPLNSK